MKQKKKKITLRPAKIDPKYIRVPNICFSLTDKNDKREKRYRKERLKYGFDQSELWCLYSTISKFIYPRLKLFRDNLHGCPGTFSFDKDGNDLGVNVGIEKWGEIIDKMLYSFDMILYPKKHEQCKYDELYSTLKNEKERRMLDKRIQEGFNLFAKYFQCLWN